MPTRNNGGGGGGGGGFNGGGIFGGIRDFFSRGGAHNEMRGGHNDRNNIRGRGDLNDYNQPWPDMGDPPPDPGIPLGPPGPNNPWMDQNPMGGGLFSNGLIGDRKLGKREKKLGGIIQTIFGGGGV